MGREGQMLVCFFVALACMLVASWIGNPIRPIHLVLMILATICCIVSIVLYFGWLQKKEDKIIIAIVMILTALYNIVKRFI